ncbi:hypothetical protein AHMF7605_05800 [Adhaeribacter arboris]|uniref:histidine kinase n=1 Tax=Adhaeribacter arboris TaxID=2072846 RepID=A0A2T2YC53_9BACT|nr:sensor histidine kinase [Adhaeribacter arboris]PSR53073.1 hypothetical protein AHMF7605_05800 [Adhaeribacter arboris]
MKIQLYSKVLLIQLLFTSLISYGQIGQVKFNLVEGMNGISVGKVTGITQDPQGYVWFADQTQRCITRFDGYQMKSYRYNPSNPNSLGGNYPESIWADSAGTIWIGFYGMGLDRFEPETNTFTHYRHNPDDNTSLSNDSVTAILVDHKGIVWIGSYGGLDRLDPITGNFTHYRHHPEDKNSLSNNRIRALYEDRQGTLWIGTGLPWEPKPPEIGGLNRFNRQTESFTRYLHDPQNAHSLIDNNVRAIYEDTRGTFWVGTAGDGLHTMDREKGSFIRHTYNPAQPNQLSRPPVKKSSIYDHITFITEDGAGAIWIGTFLEGITHYDPGTKKLTHYSNDVNSSSGFKDNSGWVSYTSRDGILWVSTQQNNLYRIDPFHKQIPHTNLESRVLALQEEMPGILWVGTENGLKIHDRNKNKIQTFIHDPSNPASISSNIIYSIYKDKSGTMWVGTLNGLSYTQAPNRAFNKYLFQHLNNEIFAGRFVTAIFEDGSRQFWLGTHRGLILMNRNSRMFKYFLHHPKDPTSLSNNYISVIQEDQLKNIWVGTWYGGGVNLFNKQTGKFQRFLAGYTVNSIYEDAFGNIWVGTENGLFRFDEHINKFINFHHSQFDLSTAFVTSIIEDNQKNLWISTLSGIYRLNQKQNEIIVYGKNYGVNTTSLMAAAVYKTKQGELLFGNSNGYFTFYPEKTVNTSQPPSILLTDFKINNLLVKREATSPLKKPLTQSNLIKLQHNQNSFSFYLAGIHYGNPAGNQHFYKLDGYDNTWREAGTDNTIYYPKVPNGSYNLRVKVANNDSLWATKSIRIIILPPWWLTWWAYTVYGLCLIAMGIAFDRYQRKRLIQKEREKARERELEQAHEIEKAYHKLKQTQEQLVQKEKMASLGELTAGIAHEIQNPLNFVNNFSEVSTELIDEIKQETIANHTKEVLAIADDLKQNLEKIHHHGKRADAIVKSMLQHSRSSTGEKELININDLAEENLRLAYHGLRAKDKNFNASLLTDFDKSIYKVEVVPQEIGRVLLNLFNNAFYATQQKKARLNGQYEPEVKVTTRQLDGSIQIRVRDNGMGIPENVQSKIFQPFFTTKPTGQGTGLGLSLSYDIITKGHGGELRVDSKEGEFTEFSIILPRSTKALIV